MRIRYVMAVATSAVVLTLSGCDAIRDAWNDPELEAALRQEPGRAGKVGTVVALGVRQNALESARSIAAPLEPACVADLKRGESRHASLLVERTRDDEFLLRWDESKRLRHGVEGGWRYEWSADFVTLVGTSGTRSGGLIELEDAVWVGRDPGPLWYRADELSGRASSRFVDTLDALVGLARWRRDGPNRWTAGTAAFRCSLNQSDVDWAARIEANRGELVRQRFERTARGDRELDLEWKMPDGTMLSVKWRDWPASEGAEDQRSVAAPPQSQTVDAERDLSYKAAHDAVDRWTAEGLMERTTDESTRPEVD